MSYNSLRRSKDKVRVVNEQILTVQLTGNIDDGIFTVLPCAILRVLDINDFGRQCREYHIREVHIDPQRAGAMVSGVTRQGQVVPELSGVDGRTPPDNPGGC